MKQGKSGLEIWKQIPDYENLYEASNLGRIKSLRTGQVMRPSTSGAYQHVSLWKNKKLKYHKVHRLVLAAFKGKSSLICNHKDFDKHNNKLDNLEYVTASQNAKHAIQGGRRSALKGEDHSNAKLTEKQVKKIKQLLVSGVSCSEIGKLFNTKPNTITCIKTGRSWKHVPYPDC